MNRNNDHAGFAKRLAIIAERHGGVTRLAQDASMSPSGLSRYLNGGVFPNLVSAVAIAKAGHVSLDWLTTGRGTMDTRGPTDEETVAFYDLRASAGPGLLVEKEPAAEKIPLPLAEIRRQTGVDSSDLCALLANGDSMEPTIFHGALLLLDRASQQAREGIYVVTRGDDILVKRIQPMGARFLRLISDNPRYGHEDVSLEDSSAPVRLVGRVIWIGQPL